MFLYLYVFEPVGHFLPILLNIPSGRGVSGSGSGSGSCIFCIFTEILFFLHTSLFLYLYVFEPLGHFLPVL